MTEFTVENRRPEDCRCAGDFRLVAVPGHIWTTSQQQYVQANETLLDQLGAMPAERMAEQAVAAALKKCVADLYALAKDFAAEKVTASDAHLQVFVIRGRFEASSDAPSVPFKVSCIDRKNVRLDDTSGGKAWDLLIEIWPGQISEEQRKFKADIDRTLTVVKVLLSPGTVRQGVLQTATRQLRAALRWVYPAPGTSATNPAAVPTPQPSNDDDVLDKRHEYLWQLAGIAQVGLETKDPSHLGLAVLSLDSFREEFVAREAGGVKNRYLDRLGSYCAGSALLWAAIYWWARNHPDALLSVPFNIRNFFLLACGSSVGTWLSFSLRRVILQFLDLARLEEDQLDPRNRVLFILGLTVVLGMLLAVGAVDVRMGRFAADVWNHGLYALLIGMLAGIAERAMASTISGQAARFNGAVK